MSEQNSFFNQVCILTKVQICNFFNLNIFRFTKDKKKKNTMLALSVVWILLFAMICLYVGGFAYGYVLMGMGEVIPMYLAMICSVIIFMFSMLKAGGILFQKNSYEMLCSMPVSQTAIVASRYFSMYFGDMLLAFLVMIPGVAVYGYFLRPGIAFYLLTFIETLFLPMLPMTVAVIFGAVITAISSRMKYKSLVSTALSLILIIAIFGLSSLLTQAEDELTMEMLQNLSEYVTSVVSSIYPPAVWFGNLLVKGDVFNGVLYFGISLAIFLLMLWLVSVNFQKICQNLYSVQAKHNYQMGTLKEASVLKTLYQREWKRYFSSSVYVTNTIVGPVLLVILAVALLITGTEQIEMYLPIEGIESIIIDVMPFLAAALPGMMTTTCVAVSMEGKEWWIVKSLPISAKTLFDSKILLNLSLIAPFYAISEIILLIALKPGFMDAMWIVVLPVILILFACVFGITINLLFPVFDWENDAKIVKQSASVAIGGLGGSLLILLCAVPVILFRQISSDLIKLLVSIIILLVTAGLYKRNAKAELTRLGS